MKKRPLFYLFCMVASIGGLFLTSCNDDDYAGAAPDEITAHYSNKLSDGTRSNLALTYSGHELIGKSVNFETNDSRTAQLTLQCILPHEMETQLTGISLVPDGQGGYTFEGNATGNQTGTTFSYNGTVQKGKLALDIKSPQIPTNPLVEAKCRHIGKAGVVLRISGGLDLGGLIGGKLDEFLKPVLRDVSFHADGNITASYSGMQEAAWKSSPANLVSFYMTDGNTLYVTPNVDMIIRQIRLNQAVTRADDNLITVLPKVYALLNQWSTTGLKLTYNENYAITLNKTELDPIFALLKVLPDAIRDISIGEIPVLGETTIGTLADLSALISDLSLTLYFNVKNAG